MIFRAFRSMLLRFALYMSIGAAWVFVLCWLMRERIIGQ